MTVEQIKEKRHNEALHIGCVMLSLFERHEIDAFIDAKEYDNLGRNLTEKEMEDFYNKVEVVKRSLSVH